MKSIIQNYLVIINFHYKLKKMFFEVKYCHLKFEFCDL